MPAIFLIGPPGAGKSLLAPRLAAALGVQASDLDAEVEAAAGRPIAEVFALQGEAAFRSLERAALERAVAAARGVVATGGGIAQDPANRSLLRLGGRVVFLATTPATQARRVGATAERARRPLLAAAPDLLAHLDALYAARLAGYRTAADLELDTDGSTPEQLVAALVARLGSSPAPGR